MSRLVAFSLLTCAAFAWSVPWLDREGVAALGLAFLALSVGRGMRRRNAPSLAPAGLLDLHELRRDAAPATAEDEPESVHGSDGWR